jgi:predicted metalloendopeptidase
VIDVTTAAEQREQNSKSAQSARAIDGMFQKKRFFVMASTVWRDFCDGHHCCADWWTYSQNRKS